MNKSEEYDTEEVLHGLYEELELENDGSVDEERSVMRDDVGPYIDSEVVERHGLADKLPDAALDKVPDHAGPPENASN